MQQITGRLTADAVVKKLDSGKEVVNFSIADNEVYKPKGQDDPVTVATFFNCSYWFSTNVAQVLRKGAVVQLNGRVSARPYETNAGGLAASLDFFAKRIDVLSYADKNSGENKAVPKVEGKNKGNGKNNNGDSKDDLPF